MNSQVFISYRREDGAYPAYVLYRYLINNGYSVFYDVKSLRSGDFSKEIEKNIRQCTDFILVVTKKMFSKRIFKENDWVRKEICCALENNRNIIIYLVNTEMPEATKLPENIQKVTNFNGLKQTDINEMLSVNKRLCSDFMKSIPKNADKKKLIEMRTSVYDVDFGDELVRLKIQSENAKKTDEMVISNLIGENQKVLDVGCAYGYVGHSRFCDNRFETVFGVDKSQKCIEYAKQNFGSDKFIYANMDIETENFEDNLINEMIRNGIEKFDVIFISLVLHHLKNPRALLRKLHKYLSSNGTIIIRGSDDGSKICYPDELMTQIIDSTLQISGVSDRLNGRKIYSWLSDAGYSNISVKSIARETSEMDIDEKERLFLESFSYRINYFKKNMNDNQDDDSIKCFLEMEDLLKKFEEQFYSSSFWYCEYDYIGVANK